MGREIFRRLVIAVKNLEKSQTYQELWLLGTKGYGKTCLLNALMCYLVFLKRRVIFIPDAWATTMDLVSTVRMALLFAWANNRQKIHEIMLLKTCQDMINFIRENPRDESGQKIILIIDELDELQLDNKNVLACQRANFWLQGFSSNICSITSWSFIRAGEKKHPHRVFSCTGGLTEVSIHEYCPVQNSINFTLG